MLGCVSERNHQKDQKVVQSRPEAYEPQLYRHLAAHYIKADCALCVQWRLYCWCSQESDVFNINSIKPNWGAHNVAVILWHLVASLLVLHFSHSGFSFSRKAPLELFATIAVTVKQILQTLHVSWLKCTVFSSHYLRKGTVHSKMKQSLLKPKMAP